MVGKELIVKRLYGNGIYNDFSLYSTFQYLNKHNFPVSAGEHFNAYTKEIILSYSSSKYIVMHECMHSVQERNKTALNILWIIMNALNFCNKRKKIPSSIPKYCWSRLVQQLFFWSRFLMEVECTLMTRKVMKYLGTWDQKSADNAYSGLQTYAMNDSWFGWRYWYFRTLINWDDCSKELKDFILFNTKFLKVTENFFRYQKPTPHILTTSVPKC